ncbi:hypothetical protein [Flexivirga alba]|uniref:Esterase-like activity of phytase family protein n=1 Tax=Flexivirga alba TaxID=702742 RepID=A0ABW2AKG7_9MICO
MGATALLVTALAAPATAAPPTPGTATVWSAGAWKLVSWRSVPAGSADQGVATVSAPNGRDRIVLRGDGQIPARLRAEGWWHIGDPGSSNGYLLDAYQARSAKHAKLFALTAPDGRRSLWVHHTVPGEKINNSFAAVAPSGKWFVSGEWGRVSRLLVFPVPGSNRLAKRGRNLPLAATITLTRPVRNVQGCSFASPTTLICSTNDPYHDLFRTPQQLLSISLSRPVSGGPDLGTPTELGPVPQLTGCGAAETEGVDVHNGRLLLVTHQPDSCGGMVDLFTYRLKGTQQSIPSLTS